MSFLVGYTYTIAKTVPHSTERDTICKAEVSGDAAITLGEVFCVTESEIALVVAVTFLIIGNEDILVASEFLLGDEGFTDELVNCEGKIHSIHISWFFGYTLIYASSVPN
jgi:hypothetical protein